MTKFNFLGILFCLFVGSIFFASCNTELSSEDEFITAVDLAIELDNAEEYESFMENGEVEERSSGRYSFRTLNKALKCTELNIALFSGMKSIYAPTDAAFDKLGLDRHNVCDLPKEDLIAILLYHVVDGNVRNMVVGCQAMIDGNIVQITRDRRKRFVNGARNTFTFRQSGHEGPGCPAYTLKVFAIDEVLTPPSNNIVNTAVGASPEFTSLVAAVLAADPAIAAALSDEDAVYTVFAPTNQAFADLLSALGLASLEDAVDAIGVEGLSTILLYHVVDACAFSNNLEDGLVVTTLQGETIEVDLDNLELIDKSNSPAGLVASGLDILTSNGIIHTIDKVLLPQAIIDAL